MEGLIRQGQFSASLEDIRNCDSLEQLVMWIKQLKAVKQALDAANRFKEMAVRYAQSHAAALIRVVELGGAKNLHGRERKAAEWLSNLSSSERQKYIDMCAEGLTIELVYDREVLTPQKIEDSLKKAREWGDDVLDEVQEKGIVDISQYKDLLRDYTVLDPGTRADIVDGVRHKLRQAGAVGIGEKSGLYIMPNSEKSDEVQQAVMMRMAKIVEDVESIKKICEVSNVKVYSFKKVVPYDDLKGWNKKPYMVHLAMMFKSIGVLEKTGLADEEEGYEDH